MNDNAVCLRQRSVCNAGKPAPTESLSCHS